MTHLDELDNQTLLRELGRRIAYLRISAKLKQNELAAKAGISRHALSHLENGSGGVRLDSFLSVLRSLHVLNSISAVLPEPTLTPLQLAELEHNSTTLPKRVRVTRTLPMPTWGDQHA